jgi:hypothetical protein
VEGSDRRWRGAIERRWREAAERSQVEGSDNRLGDSEAISLAGGGKPGPDQSAAQVEQSDCRWGERSQVEGCDCRWRGAIAVASGGQQSNTSGGTRKLFKLQVEELET